MFRHDMLHRITRTGLLVVLGLMASAAPAAAASAGTPASISAQFYGNAQLGSGANPQVPYHVSWTRGTCAAGATYSVAESVDGRAPVQAYSGTLTATTIDVRAGHGYRLAVSCGGASASTAFRLRGYQETAAAYTGGWSSVSVRGAWGGSEAASSAKGAAATFTCRCRALAWVTGGDTEHGSARVYVDGVLRATVNTNRGGRENRLILFMYGWPHDGRHTIRIVNLASAGSPVVAVDGFLTAGSS